MSTDDPISDVGPDEWAGERVAHWIRQSQVLERQLAPVSTYLFAAAGLRPAESVLDVGCGTGPTTRQAAQLVGAAGRVTGLDVSAEMVAAAQARPAEEGTAPIDWLVADVVKWQPVGPDYDIVLSRFGVLFFADPTAALTRLAEAVRPGGRFAVAVWGRRDASPVFELPYRVVVEVCADAGVSVEPVSPADGPFSWHDDAYVTELLTTAGWRDIAIEPHMLTLPFAGGLGPKAAADVAVDFGPARFALAKADAATRAEARRAMAEALEDEVDAHGAVMLDGLVRIVTARR